MGTRPADEESLCRAPDGAAGMKTDSHRDQHARANLRQGQLIWEDAFAGDRVALAWGLARGKSLGTDGLAPILARGETDIQGDGLRRRLTQAPRRSDQDRASFHGARLAHRKAELKPTFECSKLAKSGGEGSGTKLKESKTGGDAWAGTYSNAWREACS